MSKGIKVTISDIMAMKGRRRIVMITAYDYPSALLADKAGVDIILVGDSGGMVVLGYDDTVPVTMGEMLMFCKASSRGVQRALVVGDMPFMSYHVSVEKAVRNAGLLVKKGGVDAVKIEGGVEFKSVVQAIVRAGIPVMGHVGFTPQTSPAFTGYRSQGQTCEAALEILKDAEALEEAGVFSIVLEFMTSEVAEIVTKKVDVPTIGIGAGLHCDGQVLVFHDALGLNLRHTPRFVKRYLDLSSMIEKALQTYRDDVVEGSFPGEEHMRHMVEEEYRRLLEEIGRGAEV